MKNHVLKRPSTAATALKQVRRVRVLVNVLAGLGIIGFVAPTTAAPTKAKAITATASTAKTVSAKAHAQARQAVTKASGAKSASTAGKHPNLAAPGQRTPPAAAAAPLAITATAAAGSAGSTTRITTGEQDEAAVQEGVGSWYGTFFHGRQTASGELFNMHAFTAAHRTLPIPSYARVRNPSNGREVIVRINDRGPYVGKRVIDLSMAAAQRLGIHGVGRVQIQPLDADEIRKGKWREEDGRPSTPRELDDVAMANRATAVAKVRLGEQALVNQAPLMLTALDPAPTAPTVSWAGAETPDNPIVAAKAAIDTRLEIAALDDTAPRPDELRAEALARVVGADAVSAPSLVDGGSLPVISPAAIAPKRAPRARPAVPAVAAPAHASGASSIHASTTVTIVGGQTSSHIVGTPPVAESLAGPGSLAAVSSSTTQATPTTTQASMAPSAGAPVVALVAGVAVADDSIRSPVVHPGVHAVGVAATTSVAASAAGSPPAQAGTAVATAADSSNSIIAAMSATVTATVNATVTPVLTGLVKAADEVKETVVNLASATVKAATPARSTLTPSRSAGLTGPVQIDPARTSNGRGWWLQLGAFPQSVTAMSFQHKVIEVAPWIAPLLGVFDERGQQKLQAGPYSSREQAQKALERARDALKVNPVMVERR